MNTSSRLFAILHFSKASCFLGAGRYSWRTVPPSGLRKPIDASASTAPGWCMSRGAPGLLEAGRQEGPSLASKHPGAGLSLGDGASTLEYDSSAERGQYSPWTCPRDVSGPATTTSATTTAKKPCDVNPEVASGSVLPNVGLTAAFAAPGLRPSSRVSVTPLPLGRPSSRAPHVA